MSEEVHAKKGVWQPGEKALTLNLLGRLNLFWAGFKPPQRTGRQLYSAFLPWAV